MKLVEKIAKRIIAAVEQKHGGGYQSHIDDFDWEVAVVQDDTPNAFVLPGGKIVVFTGRAQGVGFGRGGGGELQCLCAARYTPTLQGRFSCTGSVGRLYEQKGMDGNRWREGEGGRDVMDCDRF